MLAQGFVAPTIANVPLSARNYFERAVTLFIKLYLVCYRARLASQVAAGAQHFDDGNLGLLDCLAGKLGMRADSTR